VQAILGVEQVDPYSAQTYDHANLAVLAAAAAGDASGTAIRDALRTISQGEGEAVADAVSGLAVLAGGGAVNYTGASGPCDFDEIGDITGTQFLFNRIEGSAPTEFERA
jgi:branched-chain amino acid transport system substrate-binding protein